MTDYKDRFNKVATWLNTKAGDSLASAEQSLDRMCRNFKLDKRSDWVGAVQHDWAPQHLLYGIARMAMKAHHLVNVVNISSGSRRKPSPPDFLSPEAVSPEQVPGGANTDAAAKAAFSKFLVTYFQSLAKPLAYLEEKVHNLNDLCANFVLEERIDLASTEANKVMMHLVSGVKRIEIALSRIEVFVLIKLNLAGNQFIRDLISLKNELNGDFLTEEVYRRRKEEILEAMVQHNLQRFRPTPYFSLMQPNKVRATISLKVMNQLNLDDVLTSTSPSKAAGASPARGTAPAAASAASKVAAASPVRRMLNMSIGDPGADDAMDSPGRAARAAHNKSVSFGPPEEITIKDLVPDPVAAAKLITPESILKNPLPKTPTPDKTQTAAVTPVTQDSSRGRMAAEADDEPGVVLPEATPVKTPLDPSKVRDVSAKERSVRRSPRSQAAEGARAVSFDDGASPAKKKGVRFGDPSSSRRARFAQTDDEPAPLSGLDIAGFNEPKASKGVSRGTVTFGASEMSKLREFESMMALDREQGRMGHSSPEPSGAPARRLGRSATVSSISQRPVGLGGDAAPAAAAPAAAAAAAGADGDTGKASNGVSERSPPDTTKVTNSARVKLGRAKRSKGITGEITLSVSVNNDHVASQGVLVMAICIINRSSKTVDGFDITLRNPSFLRKDYLPNEGAKRFPSQFPVSHGMAMMDLAYRMPQLQATKGKERYEVTVSCTSKVLGKKKELAVTLPLAVVPSETLYQSNPNQLFEAPLDVVLHRCDTPVPTPVLDAVKYYSTKDRLEKYPDVFVGAGDGNEVAVLRATYDAGHPGDMAVVRDPLSVATMMKMFLSKLPEPILTYNAYLPMVRAADLPTADGRLQEWKEIISELPPGNRDLCICVIHFLGQVSRVKGTDKEKLAKVMAPLFLRPKEMDPEAIGREPVCREILCALFDDAAKQ